MNWLPFCSRAPSSATPGTASQARPRPGSKARRPASSVSGSMPTKSFSRWPVIAMRCIGHSRKSAPGHERRSAGQPDAARQRVQAPPRERDAEERGPVEGRRGAPRPERQRQDRVQRPDAVDQHRDAVRPQQVGGVRPADAARQRLRRVPEDPDRVALVVVDVADRIGREVAGERPACRDGEGEITEGNRGGAGPASKETGHVGREYRNHLTNGTGSSGGWRRGPGALEPQPQTGRRPRPPCAGIQAGFIDVFACAAVGTAVALRDAVTDRWAVGNQTN